MEEIRVSVVMPAYNAEKYISEAIESVVLQNISDNVEIIVVLDGGNDNTRLVVEKAMNSLPENRFLSLIVNDENKGVAESRNIGIEKAKGEYVAFLDADDYWDTTKLDKQLRVFEQCQDKEKLKIVFSARELVDENSMSMGKVIHAPEFTDYKKTLRTNSINCSSAIMPAIVAKGTKMDHPELAEDYIYWLRLLKDGGYAQGIDEPLLKYRVSRSSKSGNKLKAAKMHFGSYRVVGVGMIEASMYFVCYAINGILKRL